MIPYTYLIGWSKHNKYYYGAQYGSKANPSNLWKTYFTSSKHVKAFRLLYGEPDIIQIRKIFISSKQCKEWETKLLIKVNAVDDEKWLNRTVSNGYPKPPKGVVTRITPYNHSEETKRKISIGNKGKKKPCSEARKEKLKKRKRNLVHNYDSTIRKFILNDIIFEGTMVEFCEKYNLFKSNVHGLIKGEHKSVKGWKIVTNN